METNLTPEQIKEIAMKEAQKQMYSENKTTVDTKEGTSVFMTILKVIWILFGAFVLGIIVLFGLLIASCSNGGCFGW